MQGNPRLSVLIQEWLNFNKCVTGEKDRRTLQRKFVQFLFKHRDPILSITEWLEAFDASCLRATLNSEPMLRDEREVYAQIRKVCDRRGRMEGASIAGLGGQSGSPEHINLITLHSAKGLEFDVVIMMSMDQGKMPRWSTEGSSDQKKEARRLFYVGLSRARHEVHMTYSGWTQNQYGHVFENGPSEFLIEVKNSLVAP